MPRFGREGPTAAALTEAVIGLFRKAGDAMPCTRLAVSASEFADGPLADDQGSIMRFFAPSAAAKRGGCVRQCTSLLAGDPVCMVATDAIAARWLGRQCSGSVHVLPVCARWSSRHCQMGLACARPLSAILPLLAEEALQGGWSCCEPLAACSLSSPVQVGQHCQLFSAAAGEVAAHLQVGFPDAAGPSAWLHGHHRCGHVCKMAPLLAEAEGQAELPQTGAAASPPQDHTRTVQQHNPQLKPTQRQAAGKSLERLLQQAAEADAAMPSKGVDSGCSRMPVLCPQPGREQASKAQEASDAGDAAQARPASPCTAEQGPLNHCQAHLLDGQNAAQPGKQHLRAEMQSGCDVAGASPVTQATGSAAEQCCQDEQTHPVPGVDVAEQKRILHDIWLRNQTSNRQGKRTSTAPSERSAVKRGKHDSKQMKLNFSAKPS